MSFVRVATPLFGLLWSPQTFTVWGMTCTCDKFNQWNFKNNFLTTYSLSDIVLGIINKCLNYCIIHILEKFMILFPKEFVSDERISGKMTVWQENSLGWSEIIPYRHICTFFKHVVNITFSEISPTHFWYCQDTLEVDEIHNICFSSCSS